MTGRRNRIVLAGGSGFLGQSLAHYFRRRGVEVLNLTRAPATAGDILWDGETIGEWKNELEGATALINLAGRTVNCRYTSANKKTIFDSRIKPTRVLGKAIQELKNPPAAWLNASTATIYQHTYGPAWDEGGEIGATREAKDEFSVRVAQAWENAFFSSDTHPTRKLALRTAMVLGLGHNSVFPTLRRLAKFGLGGRMGSGKQYVSWIHESDFCRAIEWLIDHEEIRSVVNLAAPTPVTNAEMMRIFRGICGAPLGLPAAKWMLEIGAFFLRTETELILKSRRVFPALLLRKGFVFQFDKIEAALTNLNEKS